ncbi:hypothetical protein RB601_003460 [Gaeumannomyces tritici]
MAHHRRPALHVTWRNPPPPSPSKPCPNRYRMPATGLGPMRMGGPYPIDPNRRAQARHRREARRTLKASGDYLGPQGFNPDTGLLDVETTTSSGSQPRANPAQASRESPVRERGRAKATVAGGAVHRTQIRTRWRRDEHQWSSVAEPALSPIPSLHSGASSLDMPEPKPGGAEKLISLTPAGDRFNQSTHNGRSSSETTIVRSPSRRDSRAVGHSAQELHSHGILIGTSPRDHQDDGRELSGPSSNQPARTPKPQSSPRALSREQAAAALRLGQPHTGEPFLGIRSPPRAVGLTRPFGGGPWEVTASLATRTNQPAKVRPATVTCSAGGFKVPISASIRQEAGAWQQSRGPISPTESLESPSRPEPPEARQQPDGAEGEEPTATSSPSKAVKLQQPPPGPARPAPRLRLAKSTKAVMTLGQLETWPMPKLTGNSKADGQPQFMSFPGMRPTDVPARERDDRCGHSPEKASQDTTAGISGSACTDITTTTGNGSDLELLSRTSEVAIEKQQSRNETRRSQDESTVMLRQSTTESADSTAEMAISSPPAPGLRDSSPAPSPPRQPRSSSPSRPDRHAEAPTTAPTTTTSQHQLQATKWRAQSLVRPRPSPERRMAVVGPQRSMFTSTFTPETPAPRWAAWGGARQRTAMATPGTKKAAAAAHAGPRTLWTPSVEARRAAAQAVLARSGEAQRASDAAQPPALVVATTPARQRDRPDGGREDMTEAAKGKQSPTDTPKESQAAAVASEDEAKSDGGGEQHELDQQPQGQEPQQDEQKQQEEQHRQWAVLWAAVGAFARAVRALLADVLCAFWVFIAPAFDGGSAIRQRYNASRTTWPDLAVFAFASAFVMGAVMAGVWAGRAVLFATGVARVGVMAFGTALGM